MARKSYSGGIREWCAAFPGAHRATAGGLESSAIYSDLLLTLQDETRLADLSRSIGTGLFVGSGAILSLVGPAPLFMGYLSMMAVVWCIMNVLAEMATLLPLKGISIPYFVSRFVEPSLGFAAGWK